MTTVFGDYSRYYTLLNRDKDYAGEADYVLELLHRHANLSGTTLLDLGCGTGGHDFFLAARGYAVTGVDRSAAMLAEANKHLADWRGPGPAPKFLAGDITDLRLAERFPLVLSLFHVISYQVNDQSLSGALCTAAAHLEEEGLFIFDLWYGPAVLAERPTVRIREAEDEEYQIRRRADPRLHPEQQTVEVDYTVEILGKRDGRRQTLRETHVMRYFFLPELERLLKKAGMQMIRAEEWLTGAPPSPTTWSVCVVARLENSREAGDQKSQRLPLSRK
jgi:SAM-dependent methyltransferase